jgi:hypothetical protein
MEESVKYGKDPLVEINRAVALGGDQSVEFVFRVRESEKDKAMKSIEVMVDFFYSEQPSTIEAISKSEGRK